MKNNSRFTSFKLNFSTLKNPDAQKIDQILGLDLLVSWSAMKTREFLELSKITDHTIDYTEIMVHSFFSRFFSIGASPFAPCIVLH
jgi:hypothetical protein